MKKRNKKSTGKSKPIKRPVSPKKSPRKKQKAGKPAVKLLKAPLIATATAEATDGIPSLPRLRVMLLDYYKPIVDTDPLGIGVPFPTLTQRINTEWQLKGDNRYRAGEITPATVVLDLSRDIDARAIASRGGES